MIQLDPSQYSAAAGLFRDLGRTFLATQAVIQGASSGTITADDPAQPHIALLEAHHKYYLAGSPDGPRTVQGLRELFQAVVLPQARAVGMAAFTMIYTAGWQGCLEREILAGLDLHPSPYELYEFRAGEQVLLEAWRSRIPAGFQVVPIEQSLVENPRLENLDGLLERLSRRRGSVQAFLERSFGVVVLYENRIASCCLSEYDLGECCEVNIATLEAYRRRGLATLAGAALVERALERGIRRIGWLCRRANLPSAATARRLGFEKVCDHPAYDVFVTVLRPHLGPWFPRPANNAQLAPTSPICRLEPANK